MSYIFIRVGGSNNLNFWSLLPCWNVTQTCTCTNKREEIVTACNVPYNFHLICSSQQSCEAGQASVPGSTLTAALFPEETSNALSMMSLKNWGHPIYNIIWISQVTNRIITPKYPQMLFQSWVSSVSQTVWRTGNPDGRLTPLIPLAVDRRVPHGSLCCLVSRKHVHLHRWKCMSYHCIYNEAHND